MNYDVATSEELRTERDKINAVLDSRADADRAEAEAEILALAKASGVDLKRLAGGSKSVVKAQKSVVAPKYRNADGQTWTGRGKPPLWAKAAKEAGKLGDYAI